MKQIIAIGGGGFGRNVDNLSLETYIIKQTQKTNPKICFLPQASAEEPLYVNNFYKAFLKLNAVPSYQSLFGRVDDSYKTHLLEQDIIYVGGGNTRTMLAIWREWGIDKILKEAYDKGIVLAGVSAGAICWFEQGVTDSVWPLGVLDCLGFIEGSCCPHYDTEKERRPAVKAMLEEGQLKPGIALEDLTAGHYIDGKLHKLVRCLDSANGYKVELLDKCFNETIL